jgi:hypothetical protein
MPSAKQVCPDCGHQFVTERRELQTVEGELVEVQQRGEMPRLNDLQNHIASIIKAFHIRTGWYGPTAREIADEFSPGQDRIVLVFKVISQLLKLGIVKYIEAPPDLIRFELTDFGYEPLQASNPRREQSQAQTVEDLIAIGKRRGMKNPRGWARHVMAARQAKRMRRVA